MATENLLENNLPHNQSTEVSEDFILVVDDEPANLSLLKETLSSTGLKVRIASNGLKALEIIRKQIPKLVLMDVSMPKMDGFETCRLIKADPVTESVPIIFATASSELNQKIKGFSLGAVDYITKPFHVEEVLVRVKAQLKLQQLTAVLYTKNQQLEREVRTRTLAEDALQKANYKLEQTIHKLENTQIQLIQSEKMSSLGYLVAGIAHEINNPANFIHGNLMPAREYAESLIDLVTLYQKQYPDDNPIIVKALEGIDVAFVREDFKRLLGSMETGTERISEIVLSLKKFACLDEAVVKQVDIHESIENIITLLSHRLNLGSGQMVIEIFRKYDDLPQFECYPDQLNQAFMNIISNAFDALERVFKSHEQPLSWQPRIEIQTFCDQKEVIVIIRDNGKGVSEDIREKIFEPFFTTQSTVKGAGLGLAIAHQIIVEKHGGIIEASFIPEQSTTFTIRLPIREIGSL